MEPEYSVLLPQAPASLSSPEPIHTPIYYCFVVYFNTNLPSTSTSIKRFLSFRSLNYNSQSVLLWKKNSSPAIYVVLTQRKCDFTDPAKRMTHDLTTLYHLRKLSQVILGWLLTNWCKLMDRMHYALTTVKPGLCFKDTVKQSTVVFTVVHVLQITWQVHKFRPW
jgi:hypothetical protein